MIRSCALIDRIVTEARLISRTEVTSDGFGLQATVEGGRGGRLVWRYGDWTEVEDGTQYIKNIACEVVDDNESTTHA